MSGRVLVWAGGVVVVLACAALGAYLAVAGLSKANELVGAGGGFIALASLGVAAYGVIQAHRDAASPGDQRTGNSQSVARTIAGSVTQVKDVTGTVRIGRSSTRTPSSSPAGTAPDRPAPGESPVDARQVVTDSSIGGAVTQVEGTGGDLEIDR
jgi:hypothetical protein